MKIFYTLCDKYRKMKHPKILVTKKKKTLSLYIVCSKDGNNVCVNNACHFIWLHILIKS